MTLSDALEGYWLDKKQRLSPRTVQDYALTFHRLLRFIGGQIDIAAITSDDLRRFLAKTKKTHNLSDKSVINILIALSSLWSWAHTNLGVANVVTSITRPNYTAPVIEAFTRAEITMLLGAVSQVSDWRTKTGNRARPRPRPTAARDKAIILTLLDSGMRAGELCALTIRDLDRETGHVMIRHGKGNKPRVLYIGDSARRAIWRYLSSRPDAKADAPLFASANETPMDTTGLYRMIKTCAKRAGVAKAHPHKFRHTFAITFLRNGGNMLELQSILGHASLDTIQIYVKLAQTDLQEATRRASPADNWRL